jgi:hypothetical protein
VKKLLLAAMIAAFGAAVILPAAIGSDSAYAQTKKKDKDTKKKKKPADKM